MDKYGRYTDSEVREVLGNAVLTAFEAKLKQLALQCHITHEQYDHFFETHITLKELV